MNSENKRPIQIEDLLRLKRAERPPAEFWTEFDRQLRAKQLAALVAKRPWWQRVPRLFTGFSRYHLPLGAAAVLAVTLITLQGRKSEPSAQPSVAAPPSQIGTSVTAASASAMGKTANGGSEPISPVLSEAGANHDSSHVAATAVAAPAPQTLASDATTPGQLSGIIPLLGASRVDSTSDSIALASHSLTASLAASAPAEPVLSRGLLAVNGFEARLTTRPAVEPLLQMTPPGERGRAKLLNAMVAMVSNEIPARTGERVASRLDEDHLSDQVRRLGARGDRVMWKF